MRSARRITAVAGATLALALTGVGTAYAQDTNTARVEITPNVANVGDTVRANPTCSGNGARIESLSSPAVEAFNNDHRGKVRGNLATGDYKVTLTCSFNDTTADEDTDRDTATAEATLRVRRDGDRNGPFDRNRDCADLRQARDRVQDARNELDRKNREFRTDGSANGSALSDSERDELRRLARVVDDRERDLDRERREANNRCDDRDDDVSVPEPNIPDININVTVPSAAPAPSSGGSVASNAPSVGAAETGEPPAEDTWTTVAINTAVIANSVVWVGASAKVFVDLGGLK